MSSTNDALSLLVGLAHARAAATSAPTQEQHFAYTFVYDSGRGSGCRASLRKKFAEDKEPVQEKRHIFHDKKGKLVVPGEESVTLCDCMIPECHGCHWPCENCGGDSGYDFLRETTVNDRDADGDTRMAHLAK
ncbi:hypothetical protein ANCCEY_14220 [Ancylostoma ceylanicum]|uniref:ARF7 effector protein C-terminal domain-containing protein n=1 Tax=Ancylostoma ceylanicum TaxID=53326 RepID=A0A0D6L5W9_9BILA|nr:hypothetical protein ANCCEY_14220 [Ancylostoma ceylanicum]